MLRQEAEIFEARSIVSELVWVYVLTREQLLEQASAVSATLHPLINIKVKNA